jgi:hypothetical protein
MNQPWDSPQNLAFANNMPDVYRSRFESNDPAQANHTSYLLMAGQGTAFAADKSALFGDIKDGMSNTIALVEVNNSGIVWTQPTDLDAAALDFIIRRVEQGKPGQLNTASPRGLNVGLFDGSVRTLPMSTSPDQIRKASTPNGGEVINW